MRLVNTTIVPDRQSGIAVTPKDLRERLFKRSRPVARRLEILDGESYSKDIGILWAAYKAGSFKLPEDLTQEQFVEAIEDSLKRYQQTWLMDDDSKAFNSGRGPVALIGVNVLNLVVEPYPLFFKWATTRNMIRVCVAFLNMVRHSKKTGMVVVKTEKAKMALPDHLKRYDMLHYIGKAGPDEYLYSVRGRGSDA